MKVLLSIKITIKDYFPKEEYIPYENFVCLFNNNNFNAKINLNNLSNQNYIIHKFETNNANIIYNLHMLDSFKNSLIGIYQLIINFDKIKNLNINDTLTQEETAKLIIDSKTKRKIFDNITNMGDIYLLLTTEIKILDKKMSGNENLDNNKSISKNRLNSVNNNDEINEFDFSPRTFKKNQIFKKIKNDRESLKATDNISSNNESNLSDGILDENETYSKGVLKKHKYLNNKNMLNKNSTKYNDLYNKKPYFNSSNIEKTSPNPNYTYYNFKIEEKKKLNRKKKQNPRKKVTILDLMEKKIDISLYNQKEENTFEQKNIQIKEFKNNFNFNKKQTNNHIKKNSFSSLNNNKLNSKLRNKQNTSIKNTFKSVNDNDFNSKKNIKSKNKISVNLSKKDIIKKIIPENKNKIVNNRKNLDDTCRLKTDFYRIDFSKLKNSNNIFLQTDSAMKKFLNKQKGKKKDDIKNHTLTEIKLKNLILDKSTFIKENFNNNYIKQISRGAFSPKLTLKVKFSDGCISNEINERYSNKNNKPKLYKKILTPKSCQIRKVSFSSDDNLFLENEELKKKCSNLIDFYSLLTEKLRKTCKNNTNYFKKFVLMKEKYINLKKYKNKLEEIKNTNESKKIKSHGVFHFDEEQLLNKMINIKFQENFVYQNIFGNFCDEQNLKNKINILIDKKKEMLLNLVRNIIKYYGNISQIYNENKIKKNLFIKLLEKNNIKEKLNTDLNYINYINKGNNNIFDKIITEVDEEKENEEEDEDREDYLKKNNNLSSNIKENSNIELNFENKINININKNLLKNNFEEMELSNNNKLNEIQIINEDNISENNNYDKNIIEKILIEQFPQNYKTNLKFIHQDNNRYLFGNKIFLAFIEDNDVLLKEEKSDKVSDVNNPKLNLKEFYKKYCLNDNKENKSNFIYTKKIKQKYIKIKSNDKDEQSLEKKIKNENSTTIETEKKTM